jgi:AcrR family transcriptional regulator
MASDKRTQILTAAQKLFQQHGLGRPTMEDVAKAAGMGKSSLYYYFKSQEEIFDAVLEVEIGELMKETIRQMSLQANLLGKLTAFATVKFEMARKRKSFFKAIEEGMDAEALSRFETLKKQVHIRYLQKETVIMQQLFISASTNKEINELNAEQLDDAVFIFLSALRGINREINIYMQPEDAERKLTAFCQLFYKSLT